MSRQMNILVVSDMAPLPVSGGGERALWEMASGIAGRGHRVTILCRAGEKGNRREFSEQGVAIKPFLIDRSSRLKFLRTAIFSPGAMATDIIQNFGIDFLHLHQPLAGYGVSYSSAGSRIPVLYSFHSPAPMEYRNRTGTTPFHRGGFFGVMGAGTLKLMERLCLRRANSVHVMSEYTRNLAKKHYRVPDRKLIKIPGGVDLSRFKPNFERENLRNRLGLEQTGILLMTIRNLEKRMGLDLLIRSMSYLRKDHPDLRLVIGGEGPLRSQLEDLSRKMGLEKMITFAGFIKEEELPAYYQVADYFVLPTTRLEGFGLVTVESMACGTPVIGTRVGATPELLRPVNPDLILWDLSPAAVAEHIDRLLEDYKAGSVEAEDLREASARHASRYYSWEDQVRKLEEQMLAMRESVMEPAGKR
jgi:glycosyltransferase involved in cell wall biosynthesis